MEKPFAHHESSHTYGKYIFVWLALLAFTAITVAVAGVNLGNYSIVLAIVIACIKSYLVLTIFMHLKIEQRAFKIFLFVALFFIFVSFALLFSDYSFM
jgi:cytochrome c oxidase subunit IV